MTDASSPSQLLTPHPRPGFYAWLTLHRKDLRWAAEQLGCSYEHIRLICLPFDDPARREPSAPLVRRVIRLTGGAIRADDWHPPVADILSGRAAA